MVYRSVFKQIEEFYAHHKNALLLTGGTKARISLWLAERN